MLRILKTQKFTINKKKQEEERPALPIHQKYIRKKKKNSKFYHFRQPILQRAKFTPLKQFPGTNTHTKNTHHYKQIKKNRVISFEIA